MSRTLQSRRSLIGSTMGIGAVAMTGQPGFARQATPTSGEWSFTDARGITLSASAPPKRVVAQTYLAQSLHDFGFDVVGHYGVDNSEGEFQSTGDLDLASLPSVGAYGEYDIEKLYDLEPDIIVEFSYAVGDDWSFWYLDEETANVFFRVAPIVTISLAGTPIDANIAEVETLAASLGADTRSESIRASREAFDAAADSLAAATAANPGIRVMALQGSPEQVFIANPDWHADLMHFRRLGVTFTEFVVDPGSDGFWGVYSPEDLGALPADVILTIGDLSGIPGWNSLPAVAAGQTGEWRPSTRLSYAGFTPNLEDLASIIANASIVAG